MRVIDCNETVAAPRGAKEGSGLTILGRSLFEHGYVGVRGWWFNVFAVLFSIPVVIDMKL